jgi:hypothetical protein
MANPIPFCGSNKRLTPAKGTEDNVSILHVHSNGRENISCWRLAPEELAHVQKTGEIWVSVASGESSPPIFITGFPLMQARDQDSGELQTYHTDGTHVVTDARQFATLHHGEQTYGESKKPHTYHCARVVQVLTDFNADWVYRAAGWLHDTEEDCWQDEAIEVRRARVQQRFGPAIEGLVWACTGEMFIDGVKQNRKARNDQQYAKIDQMPAAAPLKGADRVANMEECVLDRSPFGFMYVDEVLEFDTRVGVRCPPLMRLRYLSAALAIYEWDTAGKIATPKEDIVARMSEIEKLSAPADAAPQDTNAEKESA